MAMKPDRPGFHSSVRALISLRLFSNCKMKLLPPSHRALSEGSNRHSQAQHKAWHRQARALPSSGLLAGIGQGALSSKCPRFQVLQTLDERRNKANPTAEYATHRESQMDFFPILTWPLLIPLRNSLSALSADYHKGTPTSRTPPCKENTISCFGSGHRIKETGDS